MASAFSHALVAYTLGKATTKRTVPWQVYAIGIFCAVVPDADVIAFGFGISYGDFWGHRGFSHSFCFSFLLAVALNKLCFRAESRKQWWGLTFYLFFCAASHPILDAMTNGGLGVAFFSPFENSRYFFSWRPIQVSPIGIDSFFSKWGLRVIESELLYIGLPCLLTLILSYFLRKKEGKIKD